MAAPSEEFLSDIDHAKDTAHSENIPTVEIQFHQLSLSQYSFEFSVPKSLF